MSSLALRVSGTGIDSNISLEKQNKWCGLHLPSNLQFIVKDSRDKCLGPEYEGHETPAFLLQ